MRHPIVHFDSEKIKMWSDNHSPILFLTFRSSLVGSELEMLLEVSKQSINKTRRKFGQAFLIIDCSLVRETSLLLIFLQKSLPVHNKAGLQLQAIISPTGCRKEILKAIQCIDQNLMPVFERFEGAMAIINEMIEEFSLTEFK